MKHLETFEAAAEFLGKDTFSVLSVLGALHEPEGKPLIALYKLSILSEASWKHEGIELNWKNRNQEKYYGWFDFSSGSASGFSYDDFGYVISFSLVGSRLVFPTWQIAKYVGTTHLDLYRDLMLK